MAPADIIARFETIEEQQQVAEIVHSPHIHGNAEKILNDMAGVIKHAWLDNLILTHVSDLNAVKILSERKGNLKKQYITMPSG